MAHYGFDIIKQTAAALVQAVKSTGFNQGFHLPAVYQFDVGSVNKIRHALIRPFAFAFFDNSLHTGNTAAFQSPQRITDIAVFNDKIGARGIDIGFQNLIPHALAFFFKEQQLVGVGNIQAHQRAHKFNRIMRFQISRLIRNQRIGRRVRLIKTVGSKFFHLVENSAGGSFFNTVFNRAFHEHFALFGNFVAHFFTHDLTQLVGSTHCIAAQRPGNVHNLFLINHNAVGFF